MSRLSPSMEGLFEEEEEGTMQSKGQERLPKDLPLSGLDLILSRMEQSFGEVSTRLTDMSKGQNDLNKGQKDVTGRLREMSDGQCELSRGQRDLTMKLRDMLTGQQDLTDGLTDLTRRVNELTEKQEDMRKRQNKAEDIIGSVIYTQSDSNDSVNRLIEAIQRREEEEIGEGDRDRSSNPYRSKVSVSDHQSGATPYAFTTDTSGINDGQEDGQGWEASAAQPGVRVSKRLQGKSRPDYLALHNAGFPLHVPPLLKGNCQTLGYLLSMT